ncbi:MAG: hypothetical protein COU35_04065 [Candidatus Magasanikbacteria bacterium CG10_big_fil_rev_8_21_14_0_10_47_10]|uniref:Uncharacterized protein n=1 Tax=Candidatus Magasanikbacteria bacterium CG10_big_fil_rev_8_21_14_0_10_47_10 TaxID=1974652 RepID=A0A2H0TS18_9BACT|nr:MAG: hypothetical protein COU35_04065 [Candidatus Magasanikbacteria bacterium CG10_big_fil_rev_8_21_14_0_10_47_10]
MGGNKLSTEQIAQKTLAIVEAMQIDLSGVKQDVKNLRQELGEFKVEMYEFKDETYEFKIEMYNFRDETRQQFIAIDKRFDRLEGIILQTQKQSLEDTGAAMLELRHHNKRITRLEKTHQFLPLTK